MKRGLWVNATERQKELIKEEADRLGITNSEAACRILDEYFDKKLVQ